MNGRLASVVILGLLTLGAATASAELIVNGDLEAHGTLTGGGGTNQSFPFGSGYVDNWASSGSSGRYYTNVGALSGVAVMNTWGVYSYFYQENIAVTAGTEYTLSAMIKPTSTLWPENVGALIEVVWFAEGVAPTMANYASRISRVTAVNYVPDATKWNQWQPMQGSIVAPENAAGCMVLVGNKTASGWTSAYFDNVSMVPEPTTMGIACIGGAMTLLRRRNR
ncbi:MAG: PEP-CTERM sorting domain-containing protein [Planctomycetes bacterium]|jgi:hypothetical protein|nr:PEP-CTERM sorting domain-containing protein [Planctomycetota bacterium]